MSQEYIFDEPSVDWNKLHKLRPYFLEPSLAIDSSYLNWVTSSSGAYYLESLDTKNIEGFISSLSRINVILDGEYRHGFAKYSRRGRPEISHYTFCELDFFEDTQHPFLKKHGFHSLIFRAKIVRNNDYFDGFLRKTGFEAGGWSHINRYASLDFAQMRLRNIVSSGYRA